MNVTIISKRNMATHNNTLYIYYTTSTLDIDRKTDFLKIVSGKKRKNILVSNLYKISQGYVKKMRILK